MSKVFYLGRFDKYAKRLPIACADGDLQLSVDVDDVDHVETAALLEKAFRILNDHWGDPEYAVKVPRWSENAYNKAWKKLESLADDGD